MILKVSDPYINSLNLFQNFLEFLIGAKFAACTQIIARCSSLILNNHRGRSALIGVQKPSLKKLPISSLVIFWFVRFNANFGSHFLISDERIVFLASVGMLVKNCRGFYTPTVRFHYSSTPRAAICLSISSRDRPSSVAICFFVLRSSRNSRWPRLAARSLAAASSAILVSMT